MKFKIGDKVRLTREALYNKFALATKEEIFGGEVSNVDKDGYYTIEGFEDDYLEQSLELIPEESEFEYGEEIEVRFDNGTSWERKPFLYFEKGNTEWQYVTANIDKASFDAGKKFGFQVFKYARKFKNQLTRKEIAEKFGVSEDFTLVDE